MDQTSPRGTPPHPDPLPDKEGSEQRIRAIMSGEAKDAVAIALRLATRIVEPFYAGTMRLRNAMFNAGIKRIHHLPRPVISIGNITTGGTGKTPMVQWLARQLLAAGHRPACLLRGYTVGNSTTSDEATLLARSLQIPVIANADRVAGGKQLIEKHPEVDVILLDDGFQHRRLFRNLDVVLIDARNPFGYGHVLPRGMLRESLNGLRRADVAVITRSDMIDAEQRANIERQFLGTSKDLQIVLARHELSAVVCQNDVHPTDWLRGKRVFSFCGIGNPAAFREDLVRLGAVDAGHRWFSDHHDYREDDVAELIQRGKACDAEILITTEKDWVKLGSLNGSTRNPICHVQMQMRLGDRDGASLLKRIQKIIESYRLSSESPATPARAGKSTQ